MSSTKSKAAVAVAVVLFLAVAGGFVTWKFATGLFTAPDLQGFWEGSIEVQNAQLRIVVKVDKSPDGTYTATMDSVDQGAKDIPVSSMTLSNRTVRFELGSMQTKYQGDLNARATEIAGEWQQRRTKLPLTLKRTAKPSTIAAPLPATAYARRQESPLQGVWKGTLNAGGVPLRLVVKISETSPGKFVGTMDSTDQGSRNMRLTTIEFTQPIARFEIVSIGGEYEGALKEDGSEIDGTWKQLGRDYPLLLQRADPAEHTAPSASAYVFAKDTELQGFWLGTLDVGGTKLRLALKIAKATNGTYSATMDSIDQGSKDIPATTVTFNDSNVEVEWPALRALFHGKLEGGKLVGFWQQGPADYPLEFERTNRVAGTSAPKN